MPSEWRCSCGLTSLSAARGVGEATGKGWIRGQAGAGTWLVCKECGDQKRIGLSIVWTDSKAQGRVGTKKHKKRKPKPRDEEVIEFVFKE